MKVAFYKTQNCVYFSFCCRCSALILISAFGRFFALKTGNLKLLPKPNLTKLTACLRIDLIRWLEELLEANYRWGICHSLRTTR